MQLKRFILFITALAAGALVMAGCAATTRNLNPQDEAHYDASYDFSDKKQIVDRLVNPLLAAPLFPAQAAKPIIIVYPVINETSEHISTGGITDDIRMKLIQSGRFRFINERQRENIQKETQYQSMGYVDPAQRVIQGRQLGADYILSGTLRSIKKEEPRQWRLNKSERIYYSLDLTMTDLKTGEIVYADQAELAREASRPIIGW
ncbi:MAG: penicillin-binding protein activator LpoB [Pseudomonadota bacterium]